MNPVSYAVGIVAAVVSLIIVVELLRRRHLRERHALWWLVAGIFALVIAIFPNMLEWVASLLGVAVPINLVFFVSIAVLALVCIQNSAELTRSESRVRDLAEEIALIRVQLDKIEDDATKDEVKRSSSRGFDCEALPG